VINLHRVPPPWRLPEGVNLPLWEYLNTPRLAAEEDAYFAGHPLFETDTRVLDERFTVPGRLVDLGCGAGRHAIRFAARGFEVVAIDLSQSMLEAVQRKAGEQGVSLLALKANLCDLGFLGEATFDYALCMFSTLGMIRGKPSRAKALHDARRILRPGAELALHVHNLWLNLRDPQGRAWLIRHVLSALSGRVELGDRQMLYRGIPGMEVHLYRWPELKRELLGAGFRIEEVLPLDEVAAQPISAPWLLPGIRAGGWIVFASRR
jgi:SAM-dependent methyltransferase